VLTACEGEAHGDHGEEIVATGTPGSTVAGGLSQQPEEGFTTLPTRPAYGTSERQSVFYLSLMAGHPKGSGERSNAYSSQRFTNWRPHDPYWAEVEALPRKMRPRAEVDRDSAGPLGIFERPVAPGFVRPWTARDVADVLGAIPQEFLVDLSGVFLLGGTVGQRNLGKLTYGMYSASFYGKSSGRRVFLCAVPENRLVQKWSKMQKPSVAKEYTKFGATISPDGKGGAVVQFDLSSLRQYYLYDVLLHEIGHHVDREDRADSAERFAQWFAEYQHARLLEA
jgi:hypothetical protein